MSLGGMITAFGGDPKFRTLMNVKNPAIQKRIDAGLGDYDKSRLGGWSAFDKFNTGWGNAAPAATARTGEEIGAVDRYYNRDLESQLADLRNRTETATNAAAARGQAYALRNLNLSRLGQEGGGSSYDQRALGRNTSDIAVQAALDKLNAERSDIGNLEANKLALLGRRQALQDADLNRVLTPENVRRGLSAGNMNLLNSIIQQDQANKFYGLQQKTTGLDRWGKFADQTLDTVGQVAGVAGAAGGGGGGGM